MRMLRELFDAGFLQAVFLSGPRRFCSHAREIFAKQFADRKILQTEKILPKVNFKVTFWTVRKDPQCVLLQPTSEAAAEAAAETKGGRCRGRCRDEKNMPKLLFEPCEILSL